MPLFDKVKAQAAQVAQKAQEAGRAGAARLEDVQAKRQFDALLHDLSAAVYAKHAGHGGDDSQGEIDALLKKLEEFEAEHGPISGSDTAVQAVPDATQSGASPAEEGNFTL